MKNKGKHKAKRFCSTILIILILTVSQVWPQTNRSYPIVATGQTKFYNNTGEISEPAKGEAFYGQDAQFQYNPPSYTDNNNGTITDNVTGLMWEKSPDRNGDGVINYDDKLTYDEALAEADTFSLAGYNDWRLPTVKELYSLIMFYGIDPTNFTGNTDELTPFIDTNYFDFGYGDQNAGERVIDAQFATSTLYTGTTMMGNATMFGVNFADGRIKGYPYEEVQGQTKKFYVLYVRENTNYGKNDFVDNGDGTITDNATGLMWQKDDSQTGLNWEEALNWVQQKNAENYLGHNDWRLPNVKELQSIVDYSRSPQATNSAAIDSIFNCSTITDEGGGTNYPFYWSGTTHVNMIDASNAAYVCFGEALGWMQDPYGNYQLMDVHGAGAQRSDPKEGDPNNYPHGRGPQGDVVRIYNYVRLVRNVDTPQMNDSNDKQEKFGYQLNQNYPNPFNPTTKISWQSAKGSMQTLKVYDTLGREVTTLVNEYKPAGSYRVEFNAENFPSGIYFYRLTAGSYTKTMKMILMK